MKKVLIIAYYFPPLGGAGANRPLHLFKYLHHFDWEAHVLTVGPVAYRSYEPELLEGLDQRRIHRSGDYFPRRLLSPVAHWQPLTSLREKMRRSYFGKKLFALFNSGNTAEPFPDALSTWFPYATETGGQLLDRENFDLLLSSSPPVTAHLVGQALHQKSGTPWIADFRDFWSPRRIEEEFSEAALVQRARNLLEDIEANSSRRTAVNNSVAAALTDATVITNSFDQERALKWQPAMPPVSAFTIGILGDMSPLSWQPLRALLESHRNASPPSARPVDLIHVGDDTHAGEFSALQSSGLVRQCSHFGRQSRNRSIMLLNQAQLLYLAFPAGSGDHLLPNRLFDMLASGREIIVAGGEHGELRAFVKEMPNVHWYDVHRSDDGAALLATLMRQLQTKTPGHADFLMRQQLAEPYSAMTMAGKFADLFREVVG